jgi:hypothetical protein
MASETFYSPKAPVRYVHLIHADEYKGKWFYSVEMILDDSNPAHKAFLAKLETEFSAEHGAKKKRAPHGAPWTPIDGQPGKTRVRFKTNRFQNDDGTFTKGPRLVDAKKQAWNGAEIGSGSEMIIGFAIRGWDGEEGCGITLLPKAGQVVAYVPREDAGEQVAEGFDEVEGGYAVADAGGFVDEFAAGGEELGI